MYQFGQGVLLSYSTAIRWYTLAAEQGYAKAQKNLAYLKGETSSSNDSPGSDVDITGTYTSAITYNQDVDRSSRRWHFGNRPSIVIDIQQKDDVITGVMSGDRSGEIKGLIEGNKITFNYYMKVPGNSDREGHGSWMVGDDGAMFNGTWRGYSPYSSYAGKWNLIKIE